MANTIKPVEFLVIQRQLKIGCSEKILANGKKTKTELSIMLPMKAYSNSAWKEETYGKKNKTERIAVFFQDFSRKQVNICTPQKMKQYFLEWAKCHSNRWQKCRHARKQVYELMHGHVFCPGMLIQQLLENYFSSYIYRIMSLPV